ncbi:TPT domain-containing protein [Mycena sanguinolenta]|uniref:TPT domain-containing protein n=1 Tax=Mycena sanguinolenta TaxID=230812 RepID=A0A8H6YXG8_9AGAR|nr:TPT domain-containing protein [Mycena sanguinolenta]
MPPPAQPPASRAQVIGVVLFYLCAALAMVMANKWVLNETKTPLFFLMTQMFIAVILFLTADTLRMLPEKLSLEMRVCRGLVPMVGLSVLGLSLSNYTLKYVDASVYQVARGLVLPFTVGVSGVVLHTRPSLRILFACAIVTMGFFCGVFLDRIPMSLIGVGFGVASSTITATHSVVIKQSLEIVNKSTILLSWYTNLLSVFVLMPIVFLVEGTEVMKLLLDVDSLTREPGAISPLRTFVVGSLITGVVGFMMSLASLLSIKVTSPITHMVSSAVRGVAASLLGMWLFADIISAGRAASIAIILGGSVYYTWVKHLEQEAAKDYDRLPMADVERGQGKQPE